MKKKIVSFMCLCCLFVGVMAIPTLAGNSYLDISHGDIYSLTEGKDDGEDNYYVKPTTYVGDYVRVRSRCLSHGQYASGYNQVIRAYQSHPYSYGRDVVGGLVYQLDGYGAPASTWHLVGTWCP